MCAFLIGCCWNLWGFKYCYKPSLRECQGCKWEPPCTQNLKKASKMLFLCILLLKNIFGVVGNISPQQIKFTPVCPPKMFATRLDCLLKKDTLIILRNFYQIELSIVKRFSSLVAIGNARNVEGTCSISTWHVLLIIKFRRWNKFVARFF